MTAFEEIQKAKLLMTTGKRAEARQLLSALVQQDPANAQAWLALSYVTETRDQAVYCLERAVKIDPLNQEIRDRLRQFKPLSPMAAPPVRQPQQVQTPRPTAAPVSAPVSQKQNDQPIYSIIVIMTILVLIWLGIGLVQIWIPIAYPQTEGSASACITGFWNIFATIINGYLLLEVIRKKKTAVRTLYFLSAAGILFGMFQLVVASALIQACAIPLYAAVGFFTYVEKDKFTN